MVFAALIGLVGVAEACSCRSNPPVVDALAAAMIVEGTVVAVGPVVSDERGEEQDFVIRVADVYKPHDGVPVGPELAVRYLHCNTTDLTVSDVPRIWFLRKSDGQLWDHWCLRHARADMAGRVTTIRAVMEADVLGPARPDDAVDPRTPEFVLAALVLGWRNTRVLVDVEDRRHVHRDPAGAEAIEGAYLAEVSALLHVGFPPPAPRDVDWRVFVHTLLPRINEKTFGGRLLVLGDSLEGWWREPSRPPRPAAVEAVEKLPIHAVAGAAAFPALASILDRYAPLRTDPAQMVPFLRDACAAILETPGTCDAVPIDAAALLSPVLPTGAAP